MIRRNIATIGKLLLMFWPILWCYFWFILLFILVYTKFNKLIIFTHNGTMYFVWTSWLYTMGLGCIIAVCVFIILILFEYWAIINTCVSYFFKRELYILVAVVIVSKYSYFLLQDLFTCSIDLNLYKNTELCYKKFYFRSSSTVYTGLKCYTNTQAPLNSVSIDSAYWSLTTWTKPTWVTLNYAKPIQYLYEVDPSVPTQKLLHTKLETADMFGEHTMFFTSGHITRRFSIFVYIIWKLLYIGANITFLKNYIDYFIIILLILR
jgi:hypothetical protein